MRVAIIDGLGGGLGKVIIEKIREIYKDKIEIIALGTNALATASMVKAGAQSAATGENSIKVMSDKVDVIIGPISILVANSMMGEITPKMAESIANSPAKKIVLPLNRCNVITVGTRNLSMNQMVNLVMEELSIM